MNDLLKDKKIRDYIIILNIHSNLMLETIEEAINKNLFLMNNENCNSPYFECDNDDDYIKSLKYDKNTNKFSLHSKRELYISSYEMVNGVNNGKETSIQNVHTPSDLCKQIIETDLKYRGLPQNETLIISDTFELLEWFYLYGYDFTNNTIGFISKNYRKRKLAEKFNNEICNGKMIVIKDFSKWRKKLKATRIYSNPPYQKFKEDNTGGKGNELWKEFIIQADKYLEDNGVLYMIHPMNWREKPNKILELYLKNYNFIYLELNSEYRKKFKYPNGSSVGTKIDWYICQKTKLKTPTIIKSEDGTIANCLISNNIKFLPNVYNECVKSLLSRLEKYDKLEFKRDNLGYKDHINVKDNKYKFEHIFTNKKRIFLQKKSKDFDKKKVIVSDSLSIEPFYAENIGTTSHFPYIVVKDENEAKTLIDILNSKIIQFLLKICLYSNYQISMYTWKNLPRISKDFQLTNEEEKFIDNYFSTMDKRLCNNQESNENGHKYHTIENIKKNGEVFTPISFVRKIMDTSNVIDSKIDSDISCGNGNFLLEVLQRKMLNGITHLDALQTIYGVDINETNIEECKHRLSLGKSDKEIWDILNHNIICADALDPNHSGWKKVGYMWDGKQRLDLTDFM
jgi:hypothetical protein